MAKNNTKLHSQITAKTQEEISRERSRKCWNEQFEVRNRWQRISNKLFSSPLTSDKIENDEVWNTQKKKSHIYRRILFYYIRSISNVLVSSTNATCKYINAFICDEKTLSSTTIIVQTERNFIGFTISSEWKWEKIVRQTSWEKRASVISLKKILVIYFAVTDLFTSHCSDDFFLHGKVNKL